MHATRAIGTEILRRFLISIVDWNLKKDFGVAISVRIKTDGGGGAYSPICPMVHGWLSPALYMGGARAQIRGAKILLSQILKSFFIKIHGPSPTPRQGYK